MEDPNVTIIGLGNMGSALATTLLEAQHPVTVWNRTREKAEPLREQGAVLAESPAAAIEASPVVVACVIDYKAVEHVFSASDALPALAGRVIVNFSAGSPDEARTLGQWLGDRAAHYLDGNLGCYPSAVGGEHTNTVYSGPRVVFDRLHPVLHTIGKDLAHVGEDHGAANAVLLAMAVYETASLMGFFEAAAYGDAHGLALDTLARAVPGYAHTTDDYLSHIVAKAEQGDYAASEASVDVYFEGMKMIRADMTALGAQTTLIDTILELLENADTKGHGGDEFGVLYELFRGRRRGFPAQESGPSTPS